MNPTNSVPGLQIPGLDQLPHQLQGWIVIAVVVVPLLGRAWHGWTSGGGFTGAKNAILFGTNVPKPPTPPAP